MKPFHFCHKIIFSTCLLIALLLLPSLRSGDIFQVFAQNYKPAAELETLLNMRFYENNGGFLVENIQIVFPPQGVQRGEFVISRAGGEEVVSVPLRMEPFGNFPAFANLKPAGHTGSIKVGQSGDFVMAVKLGGEVITQMPFSLKEERNNDPYNPQTRFVREGLWRDHAFISAPVADPSGHIFFHFWISLRELPAGISSPRLNVHLMHGTQEVGVTRSPIVPSYIDWSFFSKDLVTPAGLAPGSPHYLTMADLKKDGEYAIVLKANGQPVKSYKFQIKGGQVQRPDQSRIDYEPHVNFLSPRYIDTTSGTGSRYAMHDMYWVKKSGR
jgi:hypothetical protein